VTTSFEIDADGRTRNISSTTTDPSSFGQHANYAVSRWRFDPASDGGTVAATGCTYQFEFEFAENVAGNRSR
jgi:outer membrane biosynthesis protein TonB